MIRTLRLEGLNMRKKGCPKHLSDSLLSNEAIVVPITYFWGLISMITVRL
jgi:hypothetical protein